MTTRPTTTFSGDPRVFYEWARRVDLLEGKWMLIDSKVVLRGLVALPKEGPVGFCVAQGTTGFSAWALKALTADLPKGQKLFWVDGAGIFQPTVLIQEAEAWGIDRFHYLSRVDVVRPPSVSHLLRLIHSELLSRPIHSYPVVLANTLDFFTKDLTVEEQEALFGQYIDLLDQLSMPVLLLEESLDLKINSPHLKILIQRARALALFDRNQDVFELAALRDSSHTPVVLAVQ